MARPPFYPLHSLDCMGIPGSYNTNMEVYHQGFSAYKALPLATISFTLAASTWNMPVDCSVPSRFQRGEDFFKKHSCPKQLTTLSLFVYLIKFLLDKLENACHYAHSGEEIIQIKSYGIIK